MKRQIDRGSVLDIIRGIKNATEKLEILWSAGLIKRDSNSSISKVPQVISLRVRFLQNLASIQSGINDDGIENSFG